MKYDVTYDVEKLVRARLQKGKSRAWLAAKCRRSENMIYKVEHGLRGSEETIRRMASALGFEMDEIVLEVKAS